MDTSNRRAVGLSCPEELQVDSTHLKVALILGVTGQTGSYLADLLLSKGKENLKALR